MQPGGADELADLAMRERKAEVNGAVGGLAVLAPLKQEAREFLRRRVRQAHRTKLLARHGVVAAQFFGHGLINLWMPRKEVEEIAASHWGYLRGVQRLRRHLAGLARKSRGEAQNLAFLRDAQDQAAAIAGVH